MPTTGEGRVAAPVDGDPASRGELAPSVAAWLRIGSVTVVDVGDAVDTTPTLGMPGDADPDGTVSDMAGWVFLSSEDDTLLVRADDWRRGLQRPTETGPGDTGVSDGCRIGEAVAVLLTEGPPAPAIVAPAVVLGTEVLTWLGRRMLPSAALADEARLPPGRPPW